MTSASPAPAPPPASVEGAALLDWTLPDDVDESTKVANRGQASGRAESDARGVESACEVRTGENKPVRRVSSQDRDLPRIVLCQPDLLAIRRHVDTRGRRGHTDRADG